MMSERYWAWDQVQLDASKVEENEDELIFRDVVVAREIVHEYDDGRAYKSAKELEDYAWTVDGQWAIAGRHPETGVLMNRGDIHGKTVNPRFVKNLKNPKTKRPMDRGVIADLVVFKKRVSPQIVSDLRSGKLADVSIGFFYSKDANPGIVQDGSLQGTEYDYAQQRMMHNHLAYALEGGRCPMPFCGIGADQIALDPFAGYQTFEECVKDIMKKNPEYTRKQAQGTCAVIEQRSKEKHKSDVEKKRSMEALRQVMSIVETALEEDIISRQDDDSLKTKEARAKAHFELSDEDWEALSDEDKQGYIDKLPEEGGEDLSEEWWATYDWNANPEHYYNLPDEGKEAVFDAGLWDCTSCDAIEATDASEAEKVAAKKRCAKYPVSFKEGKGHVTKPKEYANVPTGSFADPCNFKYPMDAEHVMAAWSYISKPENKTKGGYSDSEWSWMRGRVKAAMKRHGHEVKEDAVGDVKRFDVEASKKVTEETRKKMRELGIQ